MTDHLGNVRAVVAKNAGNLEIRMYTDYYPYGMVIQSGGTSYRYQYQGQYAEKDAETDWNAFELRMYDSRIARWLSVDPAGQYNSPYTGMGNDPVNMIDPDGAYSKVGAWWRNIVNGGGGIYKSGNTWGYNTSGQKNESVSHFGSRYGSDLDNWGSNSIVALQMLRDWTFGRGKSHRVYNNDAVAKSLRNSRVVNQARDYWYESVNKGEKTINDGLTNFRGKKAWTGGNFGFTGLVKAGVDPIEQFVGSFTPEITSDGEYLTFTIQNTTSFKSLVYGLAPDWERNDFKFGGNMTQTYIFREKILLHRIKN